MSHVLRNTVVGLLISCRVALSLTDGPNQADFSSFEPADATDLVDLSTGDLTYVLPLGSVRTPCGTGYPVALSYHAGILHEQEAEWVGLGWSLNIGAINRQVRGFPDDYSGEPTLAYMHDEGDHGWDLDFGGGWLCFSATSGISYSSKRGYSFYPITNFSIGIKYKIGEFGVGIGMDQDYRNGRVYLGASLEYKNVGVSGGIVIDGEGVSLAGSVGISQEGMSLAAFSLSSSGNVGFSLSGSSAKPFFATAFDKEGLMYQGYGWGLDFTIPIYWIKVKFDYYEWEWYYSQVVQGSGFGYLHQDAHMSGTEPTPIDFNSGITNQYGIMNNVYASASVDQAPGQHSDVLRYPPKYEHVKCGEHNLSAQDLYVVTGQGIGGAFMPFTSKPNQTVRSLDPKYDGIIGKPSGGDGTHDNPFTFSSTFAPGGQISDDFTKGMTFKMLNERALNLVDDLDYEGDNPHKTFQEGRVQGTRIEPLIGTIDNRLPSKLHGFVLQDQEGKRYYYTLPVLSLQEFVYTNTAKTPPVVKDYETFSFGRTHSYAAKLGPYASTWLLTAVTGPDYIRMTPIGGDELEEHGPSVDDVLPQQGDYGYWVRFRYEYDESHEKVSYLWRLPYYDSGSPSKVHVKDECEANRYSSSFGMRELTYLKSIETASEVAFFNTGERKDGLGVDVASYPAYVPTPIPTSDVCHNYNGTCSFSPEIKGRIIYTVPKGDLSTGIINKNDCMTILVDRDNLSAEKFMDLPNGTGIGRLVYAAGVVYDGLFGKEIGPKGRKATLHLRKDDYGCNYDASAFRLSTRQANPIPQSIGNGNIAKCVYAEDAGEVNGVRKTRIYVTAYTGKKNDKGIRTGQITNVVIGEWKYKDRWENAFLRYENLRFHSAFLSGGFIPNHNGNEIVRHRKRLENIAWYSKADCPIINGAWNPANSDDRTIYQNEYQLFHGTVDGYEEPKPYRHTRFEYDYSLAPNTPNSTADTKGRLTLNSVNVEVLDGEVAHSLPPYRFGYQNPNIPYLTHEDHDYWGYREAEYPRKPSTGVNWNLSSITSPTGGEVTMEYERDAVNASVVSLYNLVRDHPCYDGDLLWDYRDNNDLFLRKSTKGFVREDWDMRVLLTDDLSGIEPGMLCMLFYETGIQEGHQTLATMFQISEVDKASNTILIRNRGKYVPNARSAATLYVLKKAPDNLDGIRVKRIETKSLFDTYTIEYTYGEGVVDAVPDAATKRITEKLYNWHASGYGEAFIESYVVALINYDNPTIVTDGEIEDEHYPALWLDGDETARIPFNIAVGGTYTLNIDMLFYSPYGTNEKDIPINFYLDGEPEFREYVKDKNQSEYTFSHPVELEAGNHDLLIEVVSDHVCFEQLEIQSTKRHRIVSAPFMATPDVEYTSGNTNVIYKDVTVEKVDKKGAPVGGKTKYHFFTGHDWLIEQNRYDQNVDGLETSQDVLFIEDYSALVGMVKKTETLDQEGNLVGSTENQYSFGADLADQGVVLGNLDDKIDTEQKPLGAIRERCFTRVHESGAYPKKRISDVTQFLPFLTRVVTNKDGVTTEQDFGFFNARTGVPLATLRKSSTARHDYAVSVPLEFTNPDDAHIIDSKNTYRVNAGHLKANTATQGISGTDGQPYQIGDVSFSTLIQNLENITEADFVRYQFETVSNKPYQQARLQLIGKLKWNSSLAGEKQFTWPVQSADAPWELITQIDRADRYNRSVAEIDARGTGVCRVLSPYHPVQLASISNATFEENGVLTCDYDAHTRILFSDEYQPYGIDGENGWEYGGIAENNVKLVKLPEDEQLFSEHCIRVTDTYGPTRNFKLLRNKDYIMSAWVKVEALKEGRTSERFIMGGDYRKGTDPQAEFPYHLPLRPQDGGSPVQFRDFGVQSIVIDASDPQMVGNWRYIELRIPASQDIGHEDGWFARVFWGTPPDDGNGIEGGTVYLQDLRFYPADALVTSNYYDHALNLPRVTLDGNGQPGRRVSYDEFGRPVTWEEAVFSNDGTFRQWMVVQEREYHLVGDGTQIYENHFEPRNPEFYVRVDPECPSCYSQNGAINGKEGTCASLYLSGESNTNNRNRMALDIPNAVAMWGKLVKITGFFKMPVDKSFRVSLFVQKNGDDDEIGGIQPYTGSGGWQSFVYVGDLTSYSEFESATFMVQSREKDPVTLYIDELSISVFDD